MISIVSLFFARYFIVIEDHLSKLLLALKASYIFSSDNYSNLTVQVSSVIYGALSKEMGLFESLKVAS